MRMCVWGIFNKETKTKVVTNPSYVEIVKMFEAMTDKEKFTIACRWYSV